MDKIYLLFEIFTHPPTHHPLTNPYRWEEHPTPIPDDLDGVKEEIVRIREMFRQLKERLTTKLPKADIHYQVSPRRGLDWPHAGSEIVLFLSWPNANVFENACVVPRPNIISTRISICAQTPDTRNNAVTLACEHGHTAVVRLVLNEGWVCILTSCRSSRVTHNMCMDA